MGSVMSTRTTLQSDFHNAPHEVIHDEHLVGPWRWQMSMTKGGEHARIMLVSGDNDSQVYCVHNDTGIPLAVDGWSLELSQLGRMLSRVILAVEG